MANRLVAVALALLSSACGYSPSESGAEPEQALGSVRLRLGATPVDVTLVVRNVFDHSQVRVVGCPKKDHLLDGHEFCDELLVLPAGVYEVVVQSQDDQCESDQSHYKAVVEEGRTVEIEVGLVCFLGNGGLDVVVVTEYSPRITGISFRTAASDEPATKYVCGGSDDVRVEVEVTDSDTPCSELAWSFSAKDELEVDVTSSLLSGLMSVPGDPCRFSAVIDAGAPLQDYRLTFMVSDADSAPNAVTFLVHLIPCG